MKCARVPSRLTMSALTLAGMLAMSGCGVGELDSESEKALAAAQGRAPVAAPGPGPTPTASPAPVQTPSPAPTASPTPNPAATPTPAPAATPTPAPAPAPTPTPAPVGNAAVGKTLYTNNCSGCHAANPLGNKDNILRGANSPSTIMNAMVKVSVMRYLQATIGQAEARDLAAYLGAP